MKAARGFSLIELMIAVAVVGILAAIAVPSYNKSVIKSYRGNAKAFLLDVAQREQQYLLDKRSYADATALGITPPAEVSRYYTVTITPAAGPPPTFTATVTPIAGKKQFSDGSLTINEAGTKTSQYTDKW